VHCGAPQKTGERLGDDLSENSGRKSHSAIRHAVLSGAPNTARERLGDFLCDTFIQNAEGKGLEDGHRSGRSVRCFREPQTTAVPDAVPTKKNRRNSGRGNVSPDTARKARQPVPFRVRLQKDRVQLQKHKPERHVLTGTSPKSSVPAPMAQKTGKGKRDMGSAATIIKKPIIVAGGRKGEGTT